MLTNEQKRIRRESGQQNIVLPLPKQEIVKLKGSLDDITLIIKTFERPSCLNILLESVDKFYPNIKIIVADDSRDIQPLLKRNLSRIVLPFNSGASYGRNRALMAVKTPYVVTLDDDFIFTEETQLEIWLDILANSNIDLVGGNVANSRYEACIDISEGILRDSCDARGFVLEKGTVKFLPQNKGKEYGCELFDIVLQFWMAKTEAIQKFGGWSDEFKTIDHSVFFLKAFNKIKIAYCDRVKINHSHTKANSTSEYETFRHGKSDYYCNLILERFNLQKFIGLHNISFERK